MEGGSSDSGGVSVVTAAETTATQDSHQDIYNQAAWQLANGKTHDEVVNMMTQSGIDAGNAENTVTKFRVDIAQAKLDAAKKNVRNGALWCGGGVIVTLGSYAMADAGGGYSVFWGAVIFGGIQLFRGLVAQSSAQSELDAANGIAPVENEKKGGW